MSYRTLVSRRLNKHFSAAGIPKVYYFGREQNHNLLVLELLEKNLDSATSRNNKEPLSMMTILLLVDQMLTRLEAIHEKGIVH